MKIVVWVISLSLIMLGSCQSKETTNSILENSDAQAETAQGGANEVSDVRTIPSLEKLSITPVNETKGNKSLTEFIHLLKQAIKKRDVKTLYSLMDTNVISSHGGGLYGFKDLEYLWGDPKGKFLWEDMNRMVNLGGAFQSSDTLFRMPYCAVDRFFKDVKDQEWYSMCVCLRNGVPLYSSGSVKSDTLALMNYSIVHIYQLGVNKPPKGFLKVTSEENGIVGYVLKKEVYLTADYAMDIEKQKDGSWIITSFAPYD